MTNISPDMLEGPMDEELPVDPDLPEEAPVRRPIDFLDRELTPLPTWSLRELYDALGNAAVADLWKVTSGNARQVRWRGTATVERMQVLQDAIKQDEQRYREALVTIYTTGAFRRQA